MIISSTSKKEYFGAFDSSFTRKIDKERYGKEYSGGSATRDDLVG